MYQDIYGQTDHSKIAPVLDRTIWEAKEIFREHNESRLDKLVGLTVACVVCPLSFIKNYSTRNNSTFHKVD
jgi:hypothetical protein